MRQFPQTTQCRSASRPLSPSSLLTDSCGQRSRRLGASSDGGQRTPPRSGRRANRPGRARVAERTRPSPAPGGGATGCDRRVWCARVLLQNVKRPLQTCCNVYKTAGCCLPLGRRPRASEPAQSPPRPAQNTRPVSEHKVHHQQRHDQEKDGHNAAALDEIGHFITRRPHDQGIDLMCRDEKRVRR